MMSDSSRLGGNTDDFISPRIGGNGGASGWKSPQARGNSNTITLNKESERTSGEKRYEISGRTDPIKLWIQGVTRALGARKVTTFRKLIPHISGEKLTCFNWGGSRSAGNCFNHK